MSKDPNFENRLVDFVKQFPDLSLGSATQVCVRPDADLYACPKGLQTIYRGQKIRTIWNTLYPRPLNETLQEFLIHHLINFLGEAWFKHHKKLPTNERHVVINWLDDWEAHRKKCVPPDWKPGQVFSGEPTGGGQSLLALADDLYRLKLINCPLRKHKKRLQQKDSFQGARYELAVAACWARCGFKIQWWDKKDVKGPEFIASNEAAGEKVAVEAKSRHRKGVLHYPGVLSKLEEIKGDVGRLFNEALQQKPSGERFAVFLDLNMPIDKQHEAFEKKMWSDVREIVSQFPIDSPEKPPPYCLLVFTNWSWHYALNSFAGVGENLVSLPNYSDIPFANAQTFNAIRDAIGKHGCVPCDE
jgi:hypothetical protein